jgi:mannose-6-phosphate isomerase-like protein (cupin superfamily)
MTLEYPLVHVDDLQPAEMDADQGWAISEYRVPISGRDGSSTAAYHSIFRPGSAHAKHAHQNCAEIAVYLKGQGVAGMGDQRADVRAGHCRLIPAGEQHFFHNTTEDEEAMVVGFYLGAVDLEATGYVFGGDVTDEDLAMPRDGQPGSAFVHLDDVRPENMEAGDGWLISDFRLPIAAHNGSETTLFRAKFLPGAVHKKHAHENCEEIYYVISGHGLAGAGDDRVEVRGGHFHYIPAGVEHWLHNLSETEPIEVVGIYVGAGSVAATGYVYRGDVTAADLQHRTG